MNKRIKELMVKANQFAEENYNTLNGPYYNWTDIQCEKFAELIILECCKEIKSEPFNAGVESDWLKHYFGIKE